MLYIPSFARWLLNIEQDEWINEKRRRERDYQDDLARIQREFYENQCRKARKRQDQYTAQLKAARREYEIGADQRAQAEKEAAK